MACRKHIGSVEKGKLADLVLWTPAFFGVKPDLIKGGAIAAALMGDPNASIPTPQPVHYRPMFGALSAGRCTARVTFVSEAALAGGLERKLRCKAAGRGREHARQDRQEEHDPQWRDAEDRDRSRDLRGEADGELLVCEPADMLPMAQRYFLF